MTRPHLIPSQARRLLAGLALAALGAAALPAQAVSVWPSHLEAAGPVGKDRVHVT